MVDSYATFITLRRRSPGLLQEIEELPASAWRRVTLEVPARKTILLTNERQNTHAKLLTRYAQCMLIENALSDAVRFFHMDALSSAVASRWISTWRCS